MDMRSAVPDTFPSNAVYHASLALYMTPKNLGDCRSESVVVKENRTPMNEPRRSLRDWERPDPVDYDLGAGPVCPDGTDKPNAFAMWLAAHFASNS